MIDIENSKLFEEGNNRSKEFRKLWRKKRKKSNLKKHIKSRKKRKRIYETNYKV